MVLKQCGTNDSVDIVKTASKISHKPKQIFYDDYKHKYENIFLEK